MISTQKLSSIYQIIDNNYGQKFQKKIEIKQWQKDGKYYISFDINQIKLDDVRKKEMRRCKYIGIQQPLFYFLSEGKKTLLFNDILDYQLSQQKFKEYAQLNYRRILVQLILFFNEFEVRKIDWQINDLSQLYYIDGILQMLIIDYVQNNNKQEREKLFKEFIYENFQNYIPHLIDFLNSNEDEKFQNFLEYLLNEENITSGQIGVEASFEKEIKWLLNIQNFKQLIYYTPFCMIKLFDTPQQLKKLIYNVPDEMIFKQKRIHKNHKLYKELILNIEREIEISEKNAEFQQLSKCLFYIRIQDKPFTFMKYYKYTLGDIFQLWIQENPQFYKLKVYHLCQSFSTAMFDLQKAKLLHRDLKPQNLFLEDWDENNFEKFCLSSIIIGDFDRSKGQVYDKNMDDKSKNLFELKHMTALNSENTSQYDPPEIIETLKYDIWQFGLICLQIANRGIFAGCNQGGRALEEKEYNQYFSLQAIQTILNKEQYPQEFLNLLASCLEMNQEQRPSPGDSNKILWNLYKEELEKQKQMKQLNEQKSQKFIQQ